MFQHSGFIAQGVKYAASVEPFVRIGLPFVMQKYGFAKTYLAVLLTQISIGSSITLLESFPALFELWQITSLACSGATMALFTPFAGQVYGPK